MNFIHVFLWEVFSKSYYTNRTTFSGLLFCLFDVKLLPYFLYFSAVFLPYFSSYFYKSILDGDEDVPSALAQAIPSFVKLGVILPEGVDADALSKAAREAEAATSAAGRNLSKYGISKQSMASKSQKIRFFTYARLINFF